MVKINRILMNIEPYNGSEANITDEQQFRYFKLQKPEIQLEKSKTKLKSLFEVIPVIRQCTVTIENQKQQTRTQIIVIKGKIDSLRLKGRRTLSNLRMVIIDETRRLSKQIGKLKTKINRTSITNHHMEETLQKYHDRFHGIGRAQREGKDIEIHLPTKDNTISIAQKQVPYHLVGPLKERIAEFAKTT